MAATPQPRQQRIVAPLTPPGAANGTRDPLLGSVIDGRFKLRLVLGEGGMGTVYLAEDARLSHRRVALKVMSPGLLARGEFRARFEREAVLQANLPHPQIVQILDLGECPEGAFIVMEYSEGRSLARLLGELGPRPLDKALEITEQILHILDFAHGQGVVHRDLKPNNILIEERAGRELVRLLDFGIAKLLAPDGDGLLHTTLTRAGITYGTLGYMAPEQACGETEVLDHRADLYAAGVILYEMLTGELPTPQPSRTHPVRYAMWVQQNPIPSLAESHPELHIPRSVDRTVRRALERDPAQRYQSALSFLHDIKEFRRHLEDRGRVRQAGSRPGSRGLAVSLDEEDATATRRGGGLLAWGLALAASAAAGWFGWQHHLEAKRAQDIELEVASAKETLTSATGWQGTNLNEGLQTLRTTIEELRSSGEVEEQRRLAAMLAGAEQERDAAVRAQANALERLEGIQQHKELAEKEGEQARARAESLEAETERLRQANASVEQERERLAIENANLREEGGIPAELASLRAKTLELEKDLGDQAALLQKLIAHTGASGIEALEPRTQELVSELEAVRVKLEGLGRDFAAKTEEVRRLEEKVASAKPTKAAMDYASGQVAKLSREVERRGEEIAQLKREKAELAAKVGELDRQLNPPPPTAPVAVRIRNAYVHPLRLEKVTVTDHKGRPRSINLPSDRVLTATGLRDIDLGPGAVSVTIDFSRWDDGNSKYTKPHETKIFPVTPGTSEAILR